MQLSLLISWRLFVASSIIIALFYGGLVSEIDFESLRIYYESN